MKINYIRYKLFVINFFIFIFKIILFKNIQINADGTSDFKSWESFQSIFYNGES